MYKVVAWANSNTKLIYQKLIDDFGSRALIIGDGTRLLSPKDLSLSSETLSNIDSGTQFIFMSHGADIATEGSQICSYVFKSDLDDSQEILLSTGLLFNKMLQNFTEHTGLTNGVSIHVVSCHGALALNESLVHTLVPYIEGTLPGSTCFIHAGQDSITFRQGLDVLHLISESEKLFDGSIVSRLNFFNHLISNIPADLVILQCARNMSSVQTSFKIYHEAPNTLLNLQENLQEKLNEYLGSFKQSITEDHIQSLSTYATISSMQDFIIKFCTYHKFSEQHINTQHMLDALSTFDVREKIDILARIGQHKEAKQLVAKLIETFQQGSVDLIQDDLYKQVLSVSPELFKILLDTDKVNDTIQSLNSINGRLNMYFALSTNSNSAKKLEDIKGARESLDKYCVSKIFQTYPNDAYYCKKMLIEGGYGEELVKEVVTKYLNISWENIDTHYIANIANRKNAAQFKYIIEGYQELNILEPSLLDTAQSMCYTKFGIEWNNIPEINTIGSSTIVDSDAST